MDDRPTLTALHRSVGNQAVEALHERGELQAKLAVSQPSDRSEREAERVADGLVNQEDPATERPAVNAVDRQSSETDATVDGETESEIRSVTGGGQPLSESERSFFEPRFGRDFSDVRVHTGPQADEAARSINAEAFTLGTDIAFRSGAYRPDTRQGRELLAHELTHVVQQSGAVSTRKREAVFRVWYNPFTWFSEEEIQSTSDAAEAVNEHVEGAKTAFDAAEQAVDDRETAEAFARGSRELDDVSSTLESTTENIDRFQHVRGLVNAIAGLDETDVSENPDEAARHFEDLFEHAGALGQELNNPLLSGYMEFVEAVGKNNFFSNMREAFEGGMGATDAAVSQEAQNELIYGGDPRELQ